MDVETGNTWGAVGAEASVLTFYKIVCKVLLFSLCSYYFLPVRIPPEDACP